MADIVVEMASEVLPVVQKTPVIAGVCATDPFRNMAALLGQLKALGLAGVQNFPTVGLIDGQFRANLEETGMSFDKEFEMVRVAHEMDMLTTPYVFTAAESRKMAQAGADVLVCHMGLTTSGSVGAASAKSLDDCVRLVQELRDEAARINPGVMVLCHGGPIASPHDARYVLDRVHGVHGFYGASSIERLPVEEAITNTARAFKLLRIKSQVVNTNIAAYRVLPRYWPPLVCNWEGLDLHQADPCSLGTHA